MPQLTQSNAGLFIIYVIPAVISSTALILAEVIRRRLDQYHLQINSRMDELLRINKENAHATGKAEGIESERSRKAD